MATMAEELFNVVGRARNANLFQPLGAVADDDLFLRISFDKNRTVDAHEIHPHLFHFSVTTAVT